MRIVVIIGAARSGTKFMRSLLGADSNVGEVPYDVNYIWRYGNEAFRHDAIPPALATSKVKNYIRRTLCKQGKIGKNRSILVEKTVSNTLRIPFVMEVFPEARFLHLIRDGRDVVESALRMWRNPPDWGYLVQKARNFPVSNFGYAAWYAWNLVSGFVHGKYGARVWGPRYPDINSDIAELSLVEVCARQWAKCIEYAERDLANLPENRVMTVHYESLVASESSVAEIARFVGVSSSKSVLEYYRKTVRHDLGGGWNMLTEVDRKKVEKMIRKQLLNSGYDINYPGSQHVIQK